MKCSPTFTAIVGLRKLSAKLQTPSFLRRDRPLTASLTCLRKSHDLAVCIVVLTIVWRNERQKIEVIA